MKPLWQVDHIMDSINDSNGIYKKDFLCPHFNLMEVALTHLSSNQELVKHTPDPVEKANLKLALDAMKVRL